MIKRIQELREKKALLDQKIHLYSLFFDLKEGKTVQEIDKMVNIKNCSFQ